MADEEIRTDEEPEVEGHGHVGDIAEGNRTAVDEDSDDVEAHSFTSGNRDDLKEGHVGGA
jgi:hypothetical protein